MYRTDEIHTLTEFQRNTKDHIDRLKQTRRPKLLTVHGKPEVVIQDAEAYQRLLDVLDRAEAIVGVQRGLESMRAGRGKPLDEAFDSLRDELDIGAVER